MKRIALLLLVGFIAMIANPKNLDAFPDFRKAFTKKYTSKKKPEYAEKVKKAGCNLCHVRKKKKSVRNEYGKALDKLLNGKQWKMKKKAAPKKALAELDQVLGKVEKVKASDGKTYLERIKAGELPSPK